MFAGDNTGGEEYPTRPPEFVIEIVSRDDRYVDVQTKLAEYHAWGAKHIWLVDPCTRELSVYGSAGLRVAPAFEAPEFGVNLPAVEIFAD